MARGLALLGDDALLVFSVGGGSREHNVSINLVNAIELARERGRDDLRRRRRSGRDARASSPTSRDRDRAARRPETPLVESFQAVVWHALVSHPELAAQQGHWESLARAAYRREPCERSSWTATASLNELVPDPRSGRSGVAAARRRT